MPCCPDDLTSNQDKFYYPENETETSTDPCRYVFIFFGSFSVIAGVWSLLILPDSPSTAKFLTERERAVAVERVAENRTGVKNRKFSTYQLRQTFYDPKTWILFIMAVSRWKLRLSDVYRLTLYIDSSPGSELLAHKCMIPLQILPVTSDF